MSRLEAAGYLVARKKFMGKKPHTLLRLTTRGKRAFDRFLQDIKRMLEELPG